MSQPLPFSIPCLSKPVSVTDVASSSAALPAVGNQLRIVNEGPNVCFIAVGTTAQTATLPNSTPTVTSIPVYLGETVLTLPKPEAVAALNTYTAPTALNISAICRSGQTSALTVQVGEGQ